MKVFLRCGRDIEALDWVFYFVADTLLCASNISDNVCSMSQKAALLSERL